MSLKPRTISITVPASGRPPRREYRSAYLPADETEDHYEPAHAMTVTVLNVPLNVPDPLVALAIETSLANGSGYPAERVLWECVVRDLDRQGFEIQLPKPPSGRIIIPGGPTLA